MIDNEIELNIKAGVNRTNKNVTLILIGIALRDLNLVYKFHPDKSFVIKKVNYYKQLQNKIMNL